VSAFPLLSAVVCAGLCLACGNGSADKQASVTPQATESAHSGSVSVLGKWKVVADTSGRGDTGVLDLKPDGTFTMSYTMPGRSTDVGEGTYQVSASQNPFGGPEVNLSMTKYDGKPPPAGSPPLTLYYDKKTGLLRDLLNVAYARAK